MLFLAVSVVLGRRGLATLLLCLYVTEEAGRICVWDMPWPLAAECNMITNKQTRQQKPSTESCLGLIETTMSYNSPITQFK
jgi:hypothetical protein